MKKGSRVIVIGLALVGAVAIVQAANQFITHEAEARQYLNRCKEIEIGMTLKEVREVMGDSHGIQ
jgi:hypothetical protein